MHMIGKMSRGLFTAAVLGGFGFGVSGAFATPAKASAAPYCVRNQCAADCINAGALGGSCNTHDDSCNCYY